MKHYICHHPTKTQCAVLLRVQMLIMCQMKSSLWNPIIQGNKTALKKRNQELNACYCVLAIGRGGKHKLHSFILSNENLTLVHNT